MRFIAGAAFRAGLLDDALVRILSADYRDVLSRPVTLKPTTFFFRDDDVSAARDVHPEVVRYQAFLEAGAVHRIVVAAEGERGADASFHVVADAFGSAEAYWMGKIASSSGAGAFLANLARDHRDERPLQ